MINKDNHHRPEINGLRAIAILLVIFFHAGVKSLAGGFIGVDVFFVISGYFIFTILLKYNKEKNFSLINFYINRVKRILPALIVMAIVSTIGAFALLDPVEMEDFAKSLMATTLFLSNIYFWMQSGYFDSASDLKPLLHTWSLSIEIQFYILVPLVVLIILRAKGGSILMPILIFVAIIAGITSSVLLTKKMPSAAFYLTPIRGWPFFAGGMIAFPLFDFSKSMNKWTLELLSITGFLMILYSAIGFDSDWAYPGSFILIPVVGTLLVILFCKEKSYLGRALSMKPIVGIGLISYSLYIWHQPIFAYSRLGFVTELREMSITIIICLTFIISYFSWKYVEWPFRSYRKENEILIVKWSIAFLSLFFVIGLIITLSASSFREYWVSKYPLEQAIFYNKISKPDASFHDYINYEFEKSKSNDCRFAIDSMSEVNQLKVLECYKVNGPGVIVVGDSHAYDLYGSITSRFNKNFIVLISRPGCFASNNSAHCQYKELLTYLSNNNAIFQMLIYEQAGFYLIKDKNNNSARELLRHDIFSVNAPFFIDELAINEIMQGLSDLNKYVPVTWFTPRIEPHIPKRFIVQKGCLYNYTITQDRMELFDRLDSSIIKINKQFGNRISVISQNYTYKFSFPEDFLNCNDIYWSDGDHLSAAGEVKFGRRLPQNFLDSQKYD